MAATTIPTTVKSLSADQKSLYAMVKRTEPTLTVKQAIAKAIEIETEHNAAVGPAPKTRRKPAAAADATPAAKTRTRTPKVVETVEEVAPTPKRRPASRKPAAAVVETPAAETTPVVKKRPTRKPAAATVTPAEVAPKPTVRRKPIPAAKPVAEAAPQEITPVTTYVLRSHKEYILAIDSNDANVFTSTSLSDGVVFETRAAASRYVTTHNVRELDNEPTEIVAVTRTGGRGRPSMEVVKKF